MPPRAAAAGLLIPLTLLTHCNALSGVGDLLETDCAGPTCAGSPPADAAASDAGPDGAEDARTRVDANGGDAGTDALDDVTLPDGGSTLCLGLTLYVALDGVTRASSGQDVRNAPAGLAYEAGLFGMAIRIPRGVDLEYLATNNGVTLATLATGTMAMWTRTEWSMPCAEDHTFIGAYPFTAPRLECDSLGETLGANTGGGAATNATLSSLDLAGKWSASGWNHLAVAWGAQTIFTLNGAYSRAVPAPGSNGSLNQIQVAGNGMMVGGLVDDVAVWNRALSAGEIAAIATAGRSLGALCGIIP